MRRWLTNVFHLGIKELSSLAADRVLVVFIVYSFTVMVYTEAQGIKTEVENANVAVVNNDRLQLSGRIRAALLAPQFRQTPVIDRSDSTANSRRSPPTPPSNPASACVLSPSAHSPSGSSRLRHPRSRPMRRPMARATDRRWKKSNVSMIDDLL